MGDECIKAQESLTDYLHDEYHVLCVPTREDEFELQVFNDPNLTPANFEQLKEIVENALYDLKYPNNELEQELPGDQTPPSSSEPNDYSRE